MINTNHNRRRASGTHGCAVLSLSLIMLACLTAVALAFMRAISPVDLPVVYEPRIRTLALLAAVLALFILSEMVLAIARHGSRELETSIRDRRGDGR